MGRRGGGGGVSPIYNHLYTTRYNVTCGPDIEKLRFYINWMGYNSYIQARLDAYHFTVIMA